MYSLWGLAMVDFFLYLENFSIFSLYCWSHSGAGSTPQREQKNFSLKITYTLSRFVELAEASRLVVLLGYLVMVALMHRSQRALPRAAVDFDFLYFEIFSKNFLRNLTDRQYKFDCGFLPLEKAQNFQALSLSLYGEKPAVKKDSSSAHLEKNEQK